MRELAPDTGLVHLGRELVRTLQRANLLQQHLDALCVQLELAVNLERLLVQLVLHSNFAHRRAIEMVQTVDVVFDAAVVALDGGDDEQVLQVGVGAEGAVLEHDFLQQLNQLALQVVRHEGLHAARHLLRVFTLRQRGTHHLINQLPAMLVFLSQYFLPKLHVHALHHIPRLQLEQGVVIRARDERVVAQAALIRHTRHVRVALFTVLAHGEGVVVGVSRQEVLRVVIGIDDNLAKGVVHVHVRRPLAHKMLQEGIQELQAVALLDLSNQRLHRQ
mmetsp:Transcript_5703/g.10239  ORF Transcript_5703/g.10239 Transcript_5703/m.10239 type:complete len:275 (+) Transcript_5703:1294-2118(+)